MADSSVSITAGSGTAIDTFTQSNGDHRQAMVLGDAAGAQTVSVDTSGRLAAAVSGLSLATPAVTSLTSGTSYTTSCGQAGNISFWLQGSNSATLAAVTLGTIVFEQSDDGNAWAPLPMVRSDTNTVVTSISGVTIASGAALVLDAALEGVNFARARATASASSGTQYVHALLGGMPFSPNVSLGGPIPAGTSTIGSVNLLPATLTKGTQGSAGLTVQDLKDAGRTPVTLIVDSAASVTTEALQSYGGNNGTTALSAGTAAFTVPTGKTFRIQAIFLGVTGSAAGTIRFRFRYAATVGTGSPLFANSFMVVPAASGGDSETMSFPDGIEIPAGNQIGITTLGSATTMAFTISIIGYTY